MSRRALDHRLNIKPVPVRFTDGTTVDGTAEGNNAAWPCRCGALLVGRCYYQFGDTCYTECPGCGTKYRVRGDEKKRAVEVQEEAS